MKKGVNTKEDFKQLQERADLSPMFGSQQFFNPYVYYYKLYNKFPHRHWYKDINKPKLVTLLSENFNLTNTAVFGSSTLEHLNSGIWEGLQDKLVQQKAVVVKYNLMFIESRAKRIFGIWARIIAKRKKRTAWLVVFKYYLLIALFIAAPVILIVDLIFFKPFLSGRIKKQKQYFSGVN